MLAQRASLIYCSSKVIVQLTRLPNERPDIPMVSKFLRNKQHVKLELKSLMSLAQEFKL